MDEDFEFLVDDGNRNQVSGSEDWRSNCKNYKERIGYILKHGILTDVEFYVGANEVAVFRAHRLILAISSPVFEAMFYGNLPEKSTIPIPDLEPDGFRCFLRYIYTDKFCCPSPEVAFKAYQAADKYIIPTLKTKCELFLGKLYMSPDNIWALLQHAFDLHIESLVSKCMDFVADFASDSIADSNFLQISSELFQSILSRDDLEINEKKLLDAILRWGKNHSQVAGTSLENVIHPLLRQVRFDAITTQEFLSFVEKNPDILSEMDALAILKRSINGDCHEYPDWCSSSSPRRPVNNCKGRIPIAFASRANDERKTFSMISSYYPEVFISFENDAKSQCEICKRCRLKYVKLCWGFRGAVPASLDVFISVFPNNAERKILIYKNIGASGKFVDRRNGVKILRRWFLINEILIFRGDREDLPVLEVEVRLKTACTLKAMSPTMVKGKNLWMETDDFPCVAEVFTEEVFCKKCE